MSVRLFFMTIMLLFLLDNSAGAVRSVDANLIRDAQEYGKTQISSSSKDFFQPWTIEEDKSDPQTISPEFVRIYTPFLLIAADTREKSLNGGVVTITDSEKILGAYAGYLPISVTLYGAEAQFIQSSSAVISQGGKLIKTVQLGMPSIAQRVEPSSGADTYVAQGYLYFQDIDVAVDQSALLTVFTGDKREHRYHLDFTKIH